MHSSASTLSVRGPGSGLEIQRLCRAVEFTARGEGRLVLNRLSPPAPVLSLLPPQLPNHSVALCVTPLVGRAVLLLLTSDLDAFPGIKLLSLFGQVIAGCAFQAILPSGPASSVPPLPLCCSDLGPRPRKSQAVQARPVSEGGSGL